MVRIATLKDLVGYNKVIKESNKVTKEYLNLGFESESTIEQNENNVKFVATDAEGQIVGWLALHCNYSFQSDDDYASFEISVMKKNRCKGHGTALLEEAIKYVKGKTKAKQLKASVLHDNKSAIDLLKRFDFKFENDFDLKRPGDKKVVKVEEWFLDIKR